MSPISAAVSHFQGLDRDVRTVREEPLSSPSLRTAFSGERLSQFDMMCTASPPSTAGTRTTLTTHGPYQRGQATQTRLCIHSKLSP